MTAAGENWLPIPGFEGAYLVSDLGRIRSQRRRVRRKDGRMTTVPGCDLAAALDDGGYPSVGLHRGNHSTTTRVHVAVLSAFDRLPMPGEVGRHLDGNPTNNALVNLTWGTPAENNDDCIRHGTHNHATKTACKYGHPLFPPNLTNSSRARYCKACHRARSTCRFALAQHGVVLDFQTVADEKYRALIHSPSTGDLT